MSVALSKCIFNIISRLYNCANHLVFRQRSVGSFMSSIWVCHIIGEATLSYLKKVMYPVFPNIDILRTFPIAVQFAVTGMTSLTPNPQATSFFCLLFLVFSSSMILLHTDDLLKNQFLHSCLKLVGFVFIILIILFVWY